MEKPSGFRIRVLPERFGLIDAFLTFAAPAGFVLLLEGFTRGGLLSALIWAVGAPGVFALTYAVWLGLCLLLNALNGYRTRSIITLAMGLFCALLGVCNRYKLLYRSEPILFTDISQLSDAAQAATGLALEINYAEIVWIIVAFAVAIAACAALLRGGRKGGALLPALGVALLLWLPAQCTFELAGATRIDMADHARNEGTLYVAFAMENNRRELLRRDYEEQDVRARYRTLMEATPDAAQDNPNVIVILSESFTDDVWLSQYLNLTRELTPFYRRLTSTCQSGQLYVPKIGGGTSETEFEVLTGLKSQYAINPYSMGLPPMNSLASVLREKGYTATALHWYYGVYYNRYRNLRMEGFDSFQTLDTNTKAFEKKGMFVSDQEHYTSVMEILRETASRDFIFCLTMQNHGGYEYDDFRITYGADTPFQNSLSAVVEKVAANYCWLLEQSDRALEQFIGELSAFEEPTLLVFYGDHIPPFGTNVFEELGVNASGEEGHLTPYFIWSNVKNTACTVDMEAWQLGAHALTLAGLNDDPFLSYVERLRETGAKTDETYELLCYDALFGKQYAYDEGGLSPENADFEIGGSMTLEGFDVAVVADAIYLRPRLTKPDQAYKLSIDGQTRDIACVSADAKALSIKCIMPNGKGGKYNESNALDFASAGELLAQSGELSYQTHPLWETAYELVESKWYRGYEVYRSVERFPVAKLTALTAQGERWQWQPTYGIAKEAQYALDGDGRVWLSVSKKTLAGGRGLVEQLSEWNATLYAFEN